MGSRGSSAANSPGRVSKRESYGLAARFGADTMAGGFTAIPNLILEHYAELGIAPGEMLTVIHLWYWWWKDKNPYPALDTVAGMMGLSRRQVQTYVTRLSQKGLIKIEHRKWRHGPNQGLQTSSAYDFTPLIDRVKQAAGLMDGARTPEAHTAMQDTSERSGAFELSSGKNTSHRAGSIVHTHGAQHAAHEEDSHETDEVYADEQRQDPVVGPVGQGRPETGDGRPETAEDNGGDLIVHGPDELPRIQDRSYTLVLPQLNMPGKQLWTAVLDELRSTCSPATFANWLKLTHLIDVDGDTLVVGVPSSYARQWLSERLESEVAQAVRTVTGESRPVRFEVEQEWLARRG